MLHTRAQYIKQQQLQLAIAVAQHLPLELQLLQSLVKASDHDSKAPLAAVQSQLVASHATLMAAASQEIDRQNWRTANHYLQLALLIKDDTKLQDSLALTQKRIKSELKLQQSGNRSQREKLRISTVESLHDAIERGQLLEAQAILPQLIPWKDEPEEARLQNMLMSAVNVKVTQLSAQGQRMYTDGQLNSAIELWQQALHWTPVIRPSAINFIAPNYLKQIMTSLDAPDSPCPIADFCFSSPAPLTVCASDPGCVKSWLSNFSSFAP